MRLNKKVMVKEKQQKYQALIINNRQFCYMICVHWEDGGSEMSRELKGLTFHVEEGRSAGRNADIIWSYTYVILDYII